jgi:hypothetical protein
MKADGIILGTTTPEMQQLVRLVLGQLGIVWAKREGGELRIPTAELDQTGDSILNMRLDTSGTEPVLVFTIQPAPAMGQA